MPVAQATFRSAQQAPQWARTTPTVAASARIPSSLARKTNQTAPMPAKARINVRAGRILAGSVLLLIVAGLTLWAPWNDQPPDFSAHAPGIAVQSPALESSPHSTDSAPVIGAPHNLS